MLAEWCLLFLYLDRRHIVSLNNDTDSLWQRSWIQGLWAYLWQGILSGKYIPSQFSFFKKLVFHKLVFESVHSILKRKLGRIWKEERDRTTTWRIRHSTTHATKWNGLIFFWKNKILFLKSKPQAILKGFSHLYMIILFTFKGTPYVFF